MTDVISSDIHLICMLFERTQHGFNGRNSLFGGLSTLFGAKYTARFNSTIQFTGLAIYIVAADAKIILYSVT